jgi:membrane-bound inhibitor of C-type lysozyme
MYTDMNRSNLGWFVHCTATSVLGAATLALVGAVNSASATEASYQCVDGSAVRADFSTPGPMGSVRLTFRKGQSVVLPQVLSADGGRYADNAMEFWIKGNTARMTRAGATTECRTR